MVFVPALNFPLESSTKRTDTTFPSSVTSLISFRTEISLITTLPPPLFTGHEETQQAKIYCPPLTSSGRESVYWGNVSSVEYNQQINDNGVQDSFFGKQATRINCSPPPRVGQQPTEQKEFQQLSHCSTEFKQT